MTTTGGPGAYRGVRARWRAVRAYRGVRARWRAVRARLVREARTDEGSAIVEFLGVALLLLVPVVYLVLVLGELQAASFAVDGATREAARAIVTADDAEAAAQRATAAVNLALGDQGVDADGASALTVECTAACLAPGSRVTAHVTVMVPLPGVPGWLQDAVPLTVPVTASATAVVDTYVEVG